MDYYAHSKENEPPEKWQLLDDHLRNVGRLAAQFACFFKASPWGKIAGDYHDTGKGTKEWQAYLRKSNGIEDCFSKFYTGHVNHSFSGAKRLYEYSEEAGKLLSYCIAGHHGGLTNWFDEQQKGLKCRLELTTFDIDLPLDKPKFKNSLPFKIPDVTNFGFQLQFFTRMIFSCLVDGDYLDTEKFMKNERSEFRSKYPKLLDLNDNFWISIKELREKSKQTDVNRQRNLVLSNCLSAAKMPPGLFSLTVPTGGGKTLSSLAFAFEHAKIFNKRRIIYVIPFTSIIEQNASVFKQVLGGDGVLEHHCNFIPDDTDWKTRLAIENWDAPLIVTTNVQFFNSFYSRKPSICRKLHNVSESVIILDEVQAIPVEKLNPCLEIIKELTLNYGVSAVLCSATQPALNYRNQFKSGLRNVSEIIQDIPVLFDSLKRTKETFIGEIDEIELSQKLSEKNQVLCIVNTRQHALNIYNFLPKTEGSYHLSALMYPSHRSRVLDEIRKRLDNNLPCRVVSTQLIEAGVDIDFPVVFRALAGMDSIAQAAGRCNREGLKSIGDVHIFKLKTGAPPGYFRQTSQCAEILLDKYSEHLLEPECIQEYFQNYYWMNEDYIDKDHIVEICRQGSKGNIQFKDISRFQLIDELTIPIIIALEPKAVDLVTKLDFVENGSAILRKLQQYTVQIYEHQFDSVEPWLDNPKPGIFVVYSSEVYSEKTGLVIEPEKGKAIFV